MMMMMITGGVMCQVKLALTVSTSECWQPRKLPGKRGCRRMEASAGSAREWVKWRQWTPCSAPCAGRQSNSNANGHSQLIDRWIDCTKRPLHWGRERAKEQHWTTAKDSRCCSSLSAGISFADFFNVCIACTEYTQPTAEDNKRTI